MSVVQSFLKQPKVKVNAQAERDLCHSRARHICQRCTIARSTQAHHIQRRSHGGTGVADNLLSCCDACHDAIHAAPEDAYREGWLRRHNPRPGDFHFIEEEE